MPLDITRPLTKDDLEHLLRALGEVIEERDALYNELHNPTLVPKLEQIGEHLESASALLAEIVADEPPVTADPDYDPPPPDDSGV